MASIGDSPDYFFALLSWFGWLILKIFASFIGAFFLVGLLKKFGFFYVRFQSFILKFVGWLISFIVIWSGLTYWQYDLRNDREDVYQQVVYYDSNINDSEVARYLVDSDIASPVKSYLLAQTALLHKPVDLSAARPYVAQVVEAERQDNKFEQYGFKPEQIWTMQQQVYGKSLTPLAQSVDRQAQQAEQVSKITNVIIIGIAILFTLLSLIIFVLANSIRGVRYVLNSESSKLKNAPIKGAFLFSNLYSVSLSQSKKLKDNKNKIRLEIMIYKTIIKIKQTVLPIFVIHLI